MSEHVTLTLRSPLEESVSLESVVPDRFATSSEIEIARLPVWAGRSQRAIGDYFDVGGERSAIVRIVVSDPESVQTLFLEHGVPFSVCELVVVELKEGATELGRLLAALLAAECNIFGSYALLTRPRGRTALALHVEDNECAVSVLQSHQFTILGQSDISR